MGAKKIDRFSFSELLLLILLLISLVYRLHANDGVIDLAPSYSNYNGGSSSSSKMMTVEHSHFNIGVVLGMGSWVGKNIHSCMKIAISDFYALNHHYRTRLVLHTTETRRDDPVHAVSSALDLWESINAQAMIIGPETGLETKSFAVIGNKAKVPIFSFSSIFSSPGEEYPFLVRINQDEIFQFKGIASILSWYKWRSVAVIYEDTDEGKEFMPYLVGSLQDRNIRVSHKTAISPFSSTHDQILDELHQLAIAHQTIFIVHASPLLSSDLFSTAKKLGMLEEGYAWIVTDKTMNQLQTMDFEVVQSMQGVVGIKSHISSSSKLQDLSLRWKKEFYSKNPSSESRELDVISIWAYDTIWALAESIETLGPQHNPLNCTHISARKLLDEMARTSFTGLSGKFQILDGRLHSKVFAIVNVIGKGERRVGFWAPKDGIVTKIQHHLDKGRSLSSSTAQSISLDGTIIWPGFTTIPPNGLFSKTNGRKLRIAVTINDGFEQFASLHRDNRTNKTTIRGFSVDVFRAALDYFDYEVPFEFIPCVDGTYDDLVYQVYLQNYDGIVGDLTIMANRTSYVDFTVPYTDLGCGVITKRENDIWLFSRPLHPDLWLTSAAFFVLIGFVVWFIEQFYVLLLLPSITGEKLTSNLSRLVVIVWLFIVLILTSSYTATLSSMLTLQRIRFASAEDYIGIQYNTLIRSTVATGQNLKDDSLRMYNSPEEFADALSKGNKKGGVGAIIDEIPYLKIFLAKYGADYAMVASQSTSGGFGFAFQKDYASLVSNLSQAILKLREEGKLAMMEKTWFESEMLLIPRDAEDVVEEHAGLNLRNFGGLFLIGFLCCVLVLLIRINSILPTKLNYFNFIITVFQDGILAFMLRKIVPPDGQIQLSQTMTEERT